MTDEKAAYPKGSETQPTRRRAMSASSDRCSCCDLPPYLCKADAHIARAVPVCERCERQEPHLACIITWRSK